MGKSNAIRDSRRFVTNGGFTDYITVEPPNGTPFTIGALTSRRNLELDSQGYPVNTTIAHVLLSETAMADAGVAVRNSRGEVALDNYLVSWTDGTGTLRKYKIVQALPSETVGLISCKLGRYGSN